MDPIRDSLKREAHFRRARLLVSSQFGRHTCEGKEGRRSVSADLTRFPDNGSNKEEEEEEEGQDQSRLQRR